VGKGFVRFYRLKAARKKRDVAVLQYNHRLYGRRLDYPRTQVTTNDFKLSPRYYASKWKALNLSKNNSADWNIAIDILEDRITGRFFKQIQTLRENVDWRVWEFSGFVIVAIDCLLIETLEQFYRGVKRTGKDQDVQVFHDFFQRSKELSLFFDSIDKTRVFYSHIRCGILHQAQTKKKSRIQMRPSTPLVSWIDPRDHQQGILLNRNKFHTAVVHVFNDYLRQLRKGKDFNLRVKMKRKMDFIAAQA